MIERFEAKGCSVESIEDLNAFVIVLADNPTSPTKWLELQKSLSLDEQDAELGMDTYCIVTSSGATFYGGITSCLLSDKMLKIELTQEASDMLGTAGFEISLSITNDAWQNLKDGLKTLFDNDVKAPPTLVL
jgi:hypothetical protein